MPGSGPPSASSACAGGALLVDALHDDLQRRVAGLDEVARSVAVGRQPVGQGDDERVPAGAQPELERGDVEQHRVADLRLADQRRVGERRHLRCRRAGRRSARAAPGHDRPSAVTTPRRHLITDRSPPAQASLAPVSAKKTERLLNLVICLLATRRFLTVQEIRTAVPGYESGTEEAFRRMFERDKEELRELGVPLETGTNSHVHEDEPGYRIARRDYELPEIVLEPDEAAALGLAARLWQSAPLAGATGSALLKLQAAGVEPVAAPAGARAAGRRQRARLRRLPRRRPRRPRADLRLPHVRHRRAGRARTVQPWGVVSWRGRWYVVGPRRRPRRPPGLPHVAHRRDRDARRTAPAPSARRPAPTCVRWSAGWPSTSRAPPPA